VSHARLLLTAGELAATLTALSSPAAPYVVAGGVRLLEVGYGARAAFEQAHIPGAGYLDTDDIEHAPRI
jgi:thiosulfate/3-mercaptopyruvate sulfurtransferase